MGYSKTSPYEYSCYSVVAMQQDVDELVKRVKTLEAQMNGVLGLVLYPDTPDPEAQP